MSGAWELGGRDKMGRQSLGHYVMSTWQSTTEVSKYESRSRGMSTIPADDEVQSQSRGDTEQDKVGGKSKMYSVRRQT